MHIHSGIRTALAVLGLSAGLFICSALWADTDVCSDPEVAKKGQCRSESVLYRKNGQVRNATLATVTTGYKRAYDVIEPVQIYFLRIADGEHIALASFPPARSHAPRLIYEQLGRPVPVGGGLARTNPASFFYDRLIEEFSGQFCAVYQMKAPFVGEFVDCDGRGNPGGKLGYMPGIITPSEASRSVCDFVATETSQRCDNHSVGVIYNAMQRDPDGQVYYLVVSRRRIRAFPELKEMTSYGSSIPVEYEERTYRVEANNGELSLLSQSSMLCSTTCEPLPEVK